MKRTKLLFLLAVLLAGTLPTAAADQTETPPPAERRWTILLLGNPAGVQTLRPGEKGEQIYTFEYNDRGRGPKLETRVSLDKDFIPVRLETTGNDYMKGAVEESYSLTGKLARWKNAAEEGEQKLRAPAFYLSSESAYPDLAFLARALLHAPENRLALLPDGEAHLRNLGKKLVTVNGELKVLLHLAVSGLDFLPQTVWLDENEEFFGANDSWLTIVPEGAETAAAKMTEEDEKFRVRWLAEQAEKLRHQPERGVAFLDASVFDPRTGKLSDGMTVVVLGKRIEAVGPAGSVPIPAGLEILDVNGRTLLPGLWDMHAHISDTDGILDIAAGVTTARDLAADKVRVPAVKKRWDSGQTIGPRAIMAGGFIDGTGPYAFPTLQVATEAEALAAVDRYADQGFEQIKIYSSLDPALVPPIIKRAHERGLRVSGHIPNGMTAEQAVGAGLDEIQHINMPFLNFWPDAGIDTRTPARFVAVAERAAGLDLDSGAVKAFIELLKERKVVVDPTLTIFETLFTAPPGAQSAAFAAIPWQLPPEVRRTQWGGGLEPPEGMAETYRESQAATLRFVKKLYDAGVPIVAGTDDLAGFTLHRELELYVQAGIPAPEVLRLATLGAAQITKRDKELGTIEAGKLADFIVVDGNPADNISDIRKVEMTVHDGAIYRSEELYRAIGVTPRGSSPSPGAGER